MYGYCNPDVLLHTVLARGRLPGDIKPHPAVCHQFTASHFRRAGNDELGFRCLKAPENLASNFEYFSTTVNIHD